MFIALQHLRNPRSRGAQCTGRPHVASNGAKNMGKAQGYKHAAPPEQRQVSQICYYRFHGFAGLAMETFETVS